MSSGDSSAMSANGAGVVMTTATAPALDAGAAVRRGQIDVETAHRPGRGVVVIAVLALAAVAAAIAAFASREGAGLTPDSRGYLLVAEQIQLGNGLTMLDGDGKKVPLTHCPPLYPLSLWAGGAMMNGDRAAAARVIGIALFALNVALAGMIAWRASGRSAAAAMLAAGLTAVGLDLVLVHSMVWTEPMFILATFAALYFLGTFIDSGNRGMLVISAIFAATSFGTRYAGASLVLTCGLLLMFGQSPRRTWAQRIVDAFIHGSISCFAMFAFLIRNAQKTRDADGHAFAVHLPNRSDVKNALVTVAGWVVPVWPSDTTPMVLVLAMMAFGLLVAAIVVGLLFIAARNARAGRDASITGNANTNNANAAAKRSAPAVARFAR